MCLPYKKDACGLFDLKKASIYAGLRHLAKPETKVLQKRCLTNTLVLFHSPFSDCPAGYEEFIKDIPQPLSTHSVTPNFFRRLALGLAFLCVAILAKYFQLDEGI